MGNYAGEFHFAGRLTRPITELYGDQALAEYARAHPDALVVVRPGELTPADLRYAWPTVPLVLGGGLDGQFAGRSAPGRYATQPAQPTQLYPADDRHYRLPLIAPASTLLDNLRRQCDGPRDGDTAARPPGSALLDTGDAAAAVAAFERALAFDPAIRPPGSCWARLIWPPVQRWRQRRPRRRGIAAAGARGDKQAEKEMTVFLRRLQTPPAAEAPISPGPPSSS
ncbi:hypothetical protein RLIN73S_00001 [Rhodanobacter lindaniclasticus]